MSYENLLEKLCSEMASPALMRLANARWADDVDREAARRELERRGNPNQLTLLAGVAS